MTTRIISGLIGLAILIFVVCSHQILLGIGIFICAVIGINEFYNSVLNLGYRPVKPLGYIACFPILLIGLNGVLNKLDTYMELFKSVHYFSMAIFICILILFANIIFHHKTFNPIDISLTIFGMLYVPFLLSFVVLTRNLDYGLYYIWFIFIGAWGTDTFAYFTGVFFGKKKLMPSISPKKTLEGSVGGIAGCIIVTVLYGIIINNYIDNHIIQSHLVIIGALNGIVAQIGDLGASAVKRYVNIKDFGSIIPGHGGILDRFDSILFIAPVVYFYISMYVM